jgi:uncharacterized integral membrane protein
MAEPGGGGDKRTAAGGGHDHLAKLVLAAIVIALLVAFTLGNSERVKVSFVFFHQTDSLIWVLLATNVLGFGAGFLVHGRLEARKARRAKQKR